jgi:hypothetical protein
MIEEHNNACFIVKDASGQALAYVYFEDEPGRRAAAEAAHQGRSAAHGGKHRQAAAAVARAAADKRGVTRLRRAGVLV